MRYGNLCIAAHNYKNGTFFSDISKLNLGDIIEISNDFGLVIEYEVYDVYKVSMNDLSCISQETGGKRIVTLVTCDSINDNYRTIVKAKEIL